MIRLDFQNLYSEKIGAEGITKEDISELNKLVPAAHKRFGEWRTSEDAIFYDIVSDEHLIDGILTKASNVAKRFENVVVLGIGGSALGLRAAAQALLSPLWNVRNKAKRDGLPRLFVCDNVDPETFEAVLDIATAKETLFVVISKSGKTTETAAQFSIVLSKLLKEIGNNWTEHMVIITDPLAGELRPFATEHNIVTFPIPPKLGGRFSVLSAVGLFPAACVGMDIRAMIAGAKEMAGVCSEPDIEKNPAYAIGGYHYLFETRKNKNISVMVPYSDALALVSDWYAQLWAESLGKRGHGQTPVKALGATDQHSQVQLYMEGPKDKVFTFIGVDEFRTNKNVTKIDKAVGSFDYLVGHDMGAILRAEQKATTEAIAKAGRPSLTVTLPKIDANHLGQLFMLYEVATAFAGALLGINPFDQPGVELGKVLTREILTMK